MVNFADIANDMELNNVLNLGEMTSIEAIDAAVDTYSKDLFSDLPLNIPKPQFIDSSQVKKVSLATKPVSKPVQLSAPHKADNREPSTNTSSPIIYSENSDALVPAKGAELIGMLLNLRPKFIETDDEFVRILDVSKRVLSGGGKIKRGKPSTGCSLDCSYMQLPRLYLSQKLFIRLNACLPTLVFTTYSLKKTCKHCILTTLILLPRKFMTRTLLI